MSQTSSDAVPDDDGLMVALQAGDTSAFAALVARHEPPLVSFFFSNTRDIHLAEDLTQETLLRVYDQSWDYLPQGRFRGWMYRIARNLLIDNVRRRTNDALVRAVKSAPDGASVLSGLAGDQVDPAAIADQNEIAGLVGELLRQLPEEQRVTFTLHHFGQISLPEVARITHTNTATAKSRLRLAREKLRERLLARGISR